MSKYVVVIFPEEKNAYEGLRAIKELHDEGSITLFSHAVVKREADGRLSIKERQSDLPIGVGVGALVGALIGMFAGPLGAAVGFSSGTVVGAARDLFDLGVSAEFVDTIAKELSPGKSALIGEISEEWVTPLDTRMAAVGGMVIREYRDDFIDNEIQRRVDARKAELVQYKAELAATHAQRRETMKAALGKAEQRLRAMADKADERAKRDHEETQAKIQALQDQAQKAHEDAKARIEQRIAEMRADDERRVGMLKQAWKLTQEALGS